MLISVKHNYVFLCTEKCASNSVETMLKAYSDIALLYPPALRHTNYREYSQYIKPYLKEKAGIDSIETICLVREPLSWLNSWYRFRSRYKIRDPKHPKHKNSTFGIQFSEFIEAYMSPNPPSFANVGSQFSFVQDHMNKVSVDTIFLYESIGDFVEYMSNKVGRKLKIENKNVSPKKIFKSDFAQWISHIYHKKIGNKLNLMPLSIVPKVECEISEDLFCSLRKFISKDFELYGMVKDSQKHLREFV